MDCGKDIEEGRPGGKIKRLRTAKCRECCHGALDRFYELGGDMGEILNHSADRDGEHLHEALEEARRKAIEWRQKATAATAEAERWEVITKGLEDCVNLTRCPASTARKTMSPQAAPKIEGEGSKHKRPRGFWNDAVVKGIEKFNAENNLGRDPTKRELARILQQMVPEATEASVFSSISNAIQANRLLYRTDYLYLPGTEPPPKFDTEAARAARQ